MSTARERAAENATEITSMLVVGLGLLALFTGFSQIPFWVIFAVGFAVVVPIVAILTGDEGGDWEWWNDEHSNWWGWDGNRRPEQSTEREKPSTDALSTLRERYARGELTDEQFERKLDALLETEHPESAAEWRTRTREHNRVKERERT